MIANTVLKECKCNLKHTAKICKTVASQMMRILTAVNSGICLAISYFLILVTIMISSALKNATVLQNSPCWKKTICLSESKKQDSIPNTTVLQPQETLVMSLNTLISQWFKMLSSCYIYKFGKPLIQGYWTSTLWRKPWALFARNLLCYQSSYLTFLKHILQF